MQWAEGGLVVGKVGTMSSRPVVPGLGCGSGFLCVSKLLQIWMFPILLAV